MDGVREDACVAPSDPCVARQRAVRAAVEALERGLAGVGATYLKHAKAWERALVATAPKLAPLSVAMKNAGKRLRAYSSAADRVCTSFAAQIELARGLFRAPTRPAPARKPSRAMALSAEVRGARVRVARSCL